MHSASHHKQRFSNNFIWEQYRLNIERSHLTMSHIHNHLSSLPCPLALPLAHLHLRPSHPRAHVHCLVILSLISLFCFVVVLSHLVTYLCIIFCSYTQSLITHVHTPFDILFLVVLVILTFQGQQLIFTGGEPGDKATQQSCNT